MKPIPADILKLIPVTNSANIPPMIANGTLLSTRSESRILPKRINKTKNIISKLIGTTCESLLVARSCSQNHPPIPGDIPLGSDILAFTLSWASFMVLPMSRPRMENLMAP